MDLEIVAVRDSAMNAFSRPLFVPAVGVAIRSFSDEVNRKSPDNAMANHPEDFELFHIGSFVEETGVFTNIPHRSLARGKEMVINHDAS